jgi:hypothetical protein
MLLAGLSLKHDKIIRYILRSWGGIDGQKDRKLFEYGREDEMDREIIEYIYSKSVSVKQRNELFIEKLSGLELQGLILEGRQLTKEGKLDCEMDYGYLLEKLFNDKKVEQINLNVVSLIFELNLPPEEQWYFMQKCIRYCPAA